MSCDFEFIFNLLPHYHKIIEPIPPKVVTFGRHQYLQVHLEVSNILNRRTFFLTLDYFHFHSSKSKLVFDFQFMGFFWNKYSNGLNSAHGGILYWKPLQFKMYYLVQCNQLITLPKPFSRLYNLIKWTINSCKSSSVDDLLESQLTFF